MSKEKPMTEERAMWHVHLPVCRIRMGLKTHLSTIKLKERWRLYYYFKCEGFKQLYRIMWKLIATTTFDGELRKAKK